MVSSTVISAICWSRWSKYEAVLSMTKSLCGVKPLYDTSPVICKERLVLGVTWPQRAFMSVERPEAGGPTIKHMRPGRRTPLALLTTLKGCVLRMGTAMFTTILQASTKVLTILGILPSSFTGIWASTETFLKRTSMAGKLRPTLARRSATNLAIRDWSLSLFSPKSLTRSLFDCLTFSASRSTRLMLDPNLVTSLFKPPSGDC
mmetsp:Transcript_4461/g.7965  ORF Transcript_4461/g.7965 Transcript_4461/m.7965 type:complete len:204 (-) Transcript_4461:308-919(-)